MTLLGHMFATVLGNVDAYFILITSHVVYCNGNGRTTTISRPDLDLLIWNMLLGPMITILFVVTLVCAVPSILTYTNPSTWNKQCHSWPSFTPVSDVFCRFIILSYLCPHESQISMYSNPGVVDVLSRSPIKGYLDLKLSWLYFFHKPYTEDNLGFYSV